MTIEQARATAIPKPWGVTQLRQWFRAENQDVAIGEVWYSRSVESTREPSLQLKLLFTSQPLSIQVHPNDAYARLNGLPNGKSEAWYILSATDDAEVALGLKHTLSAPEFSAAISDGTIADHVAWQSVSPGDVVDVPAGTIHAIGGGLILAEIQQKSDLTFRLFDFGRHRELHIQQAIAVAESRPASPQVRSVRISSERQVLVANTCFVFERIVLPAHSEWLIDADCETWLLALDGMANAGNFDIAQGDALFAEDDRIHIRSGSVDFNCLVAYAGASGINRNLLHQFSHGASVFKRAIGIMHIDIPPAQKQFGIAQSGLRS
jgi:mannose-6-phosphate isomerase